MRRLVFSAVLGAMAMFAVPAHAIFIDVEMEIEITNVALVGSPIPVAVGNTADASFRVFVPDPVFDPTFLSTANGTVTETSSSFPGSVPADQGARLVSASVDFFASDGTQRTFSLADAAPGTTAFFNLGQFIGFDYFVEETTPFLELTLDLGAGLFFYEVSEGTITGDLEIVSQTVIPEPSALAGLGIGLLGLAIVAVRRRRFADGAAA